MSLPPPRVLYQILDKCQYTFLIIDILNKPCKNWFNLQLIEYNSNTKYMHMVLFGSQYIKNNKMLPIIYKMHL